MLGRGVKRKRSWLQGPEDEEEAEGERGPPGGPPRGAGSLTQQRQLVLGLCLEKLRHYQTGVGLSLRRSVLLANTLRQLQEDMRSDGAGPGGPEAPAGGVQDLDAAVTCPGCAEVGGGGPAPELPYTEANDPKKHPAALGAFGDAAVAVGYLSDLALDDIFEDIDTSMYESSDLPSAWVAGSLWPVSVSLWAEEDAKACSAPPGSLQSRLTDLNELDQIMEILVNS